MSEEIPDEFYEGDIEEIVIESESEESYELPATKPVEQYQRKQVDNENNLDYFYELLQTIIQKTEERPKVFWKRKETIQRAISLCDELVKEEYTLKNDVEQLFQENWKLRKRVEIIEKAKRRNKRKTSGGVISRRASEASVASRKKSIDSKRRVSMDDSKVGVALPKTEESLSNITENTESVTSKNPRKKSKRHSGMTEEEIEFCTLEEKIEDLLYEVDTLWNEVKDEPDCDEKEDIPDMKYDMNYVRNKEIDSTSSYNFKKLHECSDANQVAQVNDSKTHKISLKNISKLIDPQFMNQTGHQKERKVKLVKGGKLSPLKSNKTLLSPQGIEAEQNTSARKVTDISPTHSQEINNDLKNSAKIVRISPLKLHTMEICPKKLNKSTVTTQSKNIMKTPVKEQSKDAEPDVIIISEGSDSESGGF